MTKADMDASPRCAARSKASGERCKAPAVFGIRVCSKHGGGAPNATKKSVRLRTISKMQKFVQPLMANDPEANPVTAFETEFRRTLGRIRWYDEELGRIEIEDLTWGKTQEETIGATEFAGTNTKYEAKANAIHELQFRERRHLIDMEKIWLGAKFEQAKLDMQRAYVTQLDVALTDILTALGHEVTDPRVRQVVRDRLLALPMRKE